MNVTKKANIQIEALKSCESRVNILVEMKRSALTNEVIKAAAELKEQEVAERARVLLEMKSFDSPSQDEYLKFEEDVTYKEAIIMHAGHVTSLRPTLDGFQAELQNKLAEQTKMCANVHLLFPSLHLDSLSLDLASCSTLAASTSSEFVR